MSRTIVYYNSPGSNIVKQPSCTTGSSVCDPSNTQVFCKNNVDFVNSGGMNKLSGNYTALQCLTNCDLGVNSIGVRYDDGTCYCGNSTSQTTCESAPPSCTCFNVPFKGCEVWHKCPDNYIPYCTDLGTGECDCKCVSPYVLF